MPRQLLLGFVRRVRVRDQRPDRRRVIRENNMSCRSNKNRSSSLVQERCATSESYWRAARLRTVGSRFQGIEGKSWCSLW